MLDRRVRPLRLRRSGGARHHRIHELEVARVGVQADPDLGTVAGGERAPVPIVVLDVAGAAGGDGRHGLDRLDRLRALELRQQRGGWTAEVVGEDAEPPAMSHPDHDIAGALAVGHLEQLVEHGHHGVQALDREHLLAEVGLLHVALEAEHVDQAVQQRVLLLGLQGLAVPAGLDHLPQPHPLLVAGEVLDLVGHRAAVGLLHAGQRVEQRLALDPDAKDVGRDLRHQLGCQVQVLGLDRGIPLGLGAERVEVRRQVAVGPICLQQRGAGLDRRQQLGVGLCPGCRRGLGGAGQGRGRCGGRVRLGHDRLIHPEVACDLS